MAIFRPKPWVNSLRADPLNLFYSYIHTICDTWAGCTAGYGLTPLEKCQFFYCLNFLFLYSLESCVFFLEYRKIHFPGNYCLKKKVAKMVIS